MPGTVTTKPTKKPKKAHPEAARKRDETIVADEPVEKNDGGPDNNSGAAQENKERTDEVDEIGTQAKKKRVKIKL